jgi:uncharacterized protein
MTASTLRDSQLLMARYLRDPDQAPAPAGVEERRLAIYRSLIYNNIESFISGGFPVLRSLYEDADWHALVRSFIDGHRCHTPYFLEISQEFIHFLLHEHSRRDCDPPFMAELAHYEWAELALDVSEEELPETLPTDDVMGAIPTLSPLAWLLSYQFPVHRIGPGYRPEAAREPIYLVVYRNRQDRVQFMELNAATARLLELTRGNTAATSGDLLEALAAELAIPINTVRDFGAQQLQQFIDLAVVTVTAGAAVGNINGC